MTGGKIEDITIRSSFKRADKNGKIVKKVITDKNGNKRRVLDTEKSIPISKSLMDKYLNRCSPVIVKVLQPGSVFGHWVIVTEKVEDEGGKADYVIQDPGYKVEKRDRLSFYGDIYSVRIYEYVDGRCE